MAIGFSNDTRYVKTRGDKTTAPLRLTLKSYTGKDGHVSEYYEGGVQLANGQWIWVSTGGQLIQKESKTGKTYMNAKISLTVGKRLSARQSTSKFVTSM